MQEYASQLDTAHHEAAHAVVAHYVGAYPYQIRMTGPCAQMLWRTERSPKGRRPDIWDRRWLMVGLAGYTGGFLTHSWLWESIGTVGEMIALEATEWISKGRSRESNDDLGRASERLMELFGSIDHEARRYIKSSAAQTEITVRELWPAISAVATALMTSSSGQIDRPSILSTIAPWIASEDIPDATVHPDIRDALANLP